MTAAYFEDHPTDPDKVILRKPKQEYYKREWVGLTDEDWEQIHDKKGTALDTFAQGAVWAADQLKEKNT